MEAQYKKIQKLMLLVLLGFAIGACSEEVKSYLTRIDIQQISEEELYGEEAIVVNLVTLDLIKSLFDKVKWKPNSSNEMSEKENLELTLFFTYDETLSVKLFFYRVWFKDEDEVIMRKKDMGF